MSARWEVRVHPDTLRTFLENGSTLPESALGDRSAEEALHATVICDPRIRRGDYEWRPAPSRPATNEHPFRESAMTPIERARYRYLHDAEFHTIVDSMIQSVIQLRMTPGELRDAATFACILLAERG